MFIKKKTDASIYCTGYFIQHVSHLYETALALGNPKDDRRTYFSTPLLGALGVSSAPRQRRPKDERRASFSAPLEHPLTSVEFGRVIQLQINHKCTKKYSRFHPLYGRVFGSPMSHKLLQSITVFYVC